MAIPINHRIDAPALFILPHDDAWDTARIEAESPGEDHPITRYRRGVSRYDLETVRAYLRPGSTPTIFALRRMTPARWLELQTQMESESGDVGRTRTLALALRHGLDACKLGDDIEIKAGHNGLTDAEVDTLRRLVGDASWISIGYACLFVQNSITPTEAFP